MVTSAARVSGFGTGGEAGFGGTHSDLRVSDAGEAANEFSAGLLEAGTDLWLAHAGLARFAR